MIIVGNIGACFCFEEETERLFFHFLGSFFFFFFAFFCFSFLFFLHTYIYITGQPLTKVQALVFLVWEQQP